MYDARLCIAAALFYDLFVIENETNLRGCYTVGSKYFFLSQKKKKKKKRKNK